MDEAEEVDWYQPEYNNGVFANPASWGFTQKKLLDIFRWMINRDRAKMPSAEEIEREFPVLKPDPNVLSDFGSAPEHANSVQTTWIGHSTFLVQMEGLNFLTDPVFYDRCSPISFLGPKRYRPPSLTLQELPRIDFVIVSHDHYDHLDVNAVKYLAETSVDTHYYVGKNMFDWFVQCGVKPENVHELSWWEEHQFNENVRVSLVPCQHWTKRTLTNTFKSLWGSWVVLGSNNKVFFAGDTGYCPAFKQIGQKYGPFDVSLIPIGAYCPRWFMKCAHVNPKEAVMIHQDIKSKLSIGMHWATFVLTDEHIFEPREKLTKACEKFDVSLDAFVTVKHGQVCTWLNGVDINAKE